MLLVFSGARVAHLLLLLFMYDFSYFMFFVVYVCFPYLVFVPGLHSINYRYNFGSLDYSLKTYRSHECWCIRYRQLESDSSLLHENFQICNYHLLYLTTNLIKNQKNRRSDSTPPCLTPPLHQRILIHIDAIWLHSSYYNDRHLLLTEFYL